MSEHAHVRRCFALFLHAEERRSINLAALLSGRATLHARQAWQALAPHLPSAVDLDSTDVDALGRISEATWTPRADALAAVGEVRLQRLVDLGLVLEEGRGSPAHERDRILRDAKWHPLLATAHAFSRWDGVDSLAEQAGSRIRSTEDLIAEDGPPPPHFHERADVQRRTGLPVPAADELDALLARRATCRNFDTDAPIATAMLAAILHRTFGVQGSEEIAPGAVALKKNHPSGGGLHPLEAYLLVRRAEQLPAGLYHYNAQAHALDCLRVLPAQEAHELALTFVAGQDYFADAPVQLVIAARFARSFWKYRHHPKIHRAILLEAGHLSQNLYLAATALDMGAYITAAVNEVQIEQAFGLDTLEDGVLAECGFGPRAQRRRTVELDPLGKVWSGDMLRG